MKKVESLNNARKTVLKLEKEMTAISSNLSKVKNKDHSTMKKIINNLNYLLAKDSLETSIYQREGSEGKEESKNQDENKKIEKLKNEDEYNNGRNIDYLLLFKKHKNIKNKNINKQYFNRKCLSSSKINVLNTSIEKKFVKEYNANKNANQKENNIFDYRNKIIDGQNNFLNKTNQMTYSKPRIFTDCYKINSSNNINIGHKNNTSDKNKNFEGPIKNNYINNIYKKDAMLNTLYSKYINNTDNNIMTNNYLNIKNKKAFSYEQPNLMINNEKNLFEKEDQKYENEKDIQYSVKKNKKSNLSNKSNQIQEIVINSKVKNNNFKNSNIHYKSNHGNDINMKSHHISIIYDNSNKNNISELIKIGEDNKILTYDNHTRRKINDNFLGEINKGDNYDILGNYKTQRKKRIKENIYMNKNYSKSLNSIIINNSNKGKDINKNLINDYNIIKEDNDNINCLLNILNVNNIHEAIVKVSQLLEYEKSINKLKQLYNNEDAQKNVDLWINNIIKKYQRNEKYKNFCQNIMISNKINNFEEFKIFIKNKIKNNEKNDNNILNENNNYLNIINNDEIVNNSKKIYVINDKNNKDISSFNNNNIKFSNSNNCKIIHDYMHTYY